MNDLSKLVVTLVFLNILVGTGNDSHQRYKNKYSNYVLNAWFWERYLTRASNFSNRMYSKN